MLIQHESGIKSLEIFTISTNGENKEVLWSYSSKLDFWLDGRVRIHHPENYQVKASFSTKCLPFQ
jgi:hypothetical protein